MKKYSVLSYSLIVSSLFLPVLSLISYCIGYRVSLLNYSVFSTISALFYIVSTAVILKNNIVNKALVFLPIFSLINLAVYVYKSKSVVVLICMCICSICSAVIAEKVCNSSKAKISSVLTSVVLSVPFLIVSLAVVSFAKFGVNTVVDKIYSPDKTYYAEIVDIDQGALGGNTVVNIHKNSRLDLLFMTIAKAPQRAYVGEWGEYETMKLQWKSEQCLIIDSKEYIVEI
ncbi:MAG: hypothetical protein IJD78_02010 [Clostridia bacterium]|nr:hypothetical protein [Clostridia bacterium]